MGSFSWRSILRAAAALLVFGPAVVRAEPFALFTGAGNVKVVDVATNAVVASIAVGGEPHGAAVALNDQWAYVAIPPTRESGYIAVIDLASMTLADRISTVSTDWPYSIAVSAEGPVFVGGGPVPCPGAGLPCGAVFDPRVMQMTATFGVLWEWRGMAVDDRLSRLYVSDGVTVHIFDTHTYQRIGQMSGASPTHGLGDLALDSAHGLLYGANAFVAYAVYVYDTASQLMVANIPLHETPNSVAVSPSGTRFFVTTSSGVLVFDASTRTLVATIPLPGAVGIGITPDGAFAYVTRVGVESVTVIRLQDLALVAEIAVDGSNYARGQFIGGTSTPADQMPGPLTGLWWNPAQSGWGLHLTQRANTVFGAWFTYDENGNSKWYVASACRMQPALPCEVCVTGSFCTGELYEARGPRFFLEPFHAVSVHTTRVGTLQIDFADEDHAHMTSLIGGQVAGIDLEREVFASGHAPTVDYTDLWYNALESGWGLGLVQQGRTMFVAWYNYGDYGQSAWNVASNCAVHDDGNGCSGRVYRASGPIGPATGKPFDPSRVSVADVGWIELRFSGPNNGQIRWQVDGREGQRAIVRQVF